MDPVFVAARLLLAAVFLVSALAKVADRTGARQALVDFGLPPRLAGPLQIALPAAEAITAVTLIPSSTAWWGALAALCLLLLFSAAIAYNLAAGRRPDCHCFGQLHAEPIGRSSLARNVLLSAVAGLLLWHGPAQPPLGLAPALTALKGTQLAVLLFAAATVTALAVQGWFIVHLLRQNGRLLLRLEALESGLAAGSPGRLTAPRSEATPELRPGMAAAPFRLPSTDGRRVGLNDLLAAGQPLLLLFVDPHCGPCAHLLPQVARWQRNHSERLTVALISRGATEENDGLTRDHGLHNILLQREEEVALAYGARYTPSAVAITPEGTLGSPVAAGATAIEALVRDVLGQPPSESPPVRLGKTSTALLDLARKQSAENGSSATVQVDNGQ